MHVPDGFLNATTSLGTGLVSAGSVGVVMRRARQIGDRAIPLTGLVAAFIFVAQMINFPVGAGTSGHLIGGALAAILLGPWMAVAAMVVVVGVQAVVFADGGLTALGTNLLNLALVAPLVGWLLARTAARWGRGGTRAIGFGSLLAGAGSVVAAAGAFVIEYGMGGQGGADLRAVAAAMLGVHIVIGVVEGVATAGVVRAVMKVRPDLVAVAAGLGGARQPAATRRRVALGLGAATLGLAIAVVPFASSAPDGLQRVANEQGFAPTAEEHALATSPLAGYTADVDDGAGGTRVAAVAGGALVLTMAGAVALAASRRRAS